ncbi:MAG: hypothetical protein HY836_07595, partial [Aquabacterium sp.]|nr:hypothetical protein [Aquabacterium sp.]
MQRLQCAPLGGEHAPGQGLGAAGNASAEPLYEARFEAQRAAIPVRPALTDDKGALLHPKPTVWGTQTALVVGLDGPIHTDRDDRIKVQFHWQRGAGSSHRLDHTAGCNAPRVGCFRHLGACGARLGRRQLGWRVHTSPGPGSGHRLRGGGHRPPRG